MAYPTSSAFQDAIRLSGQRKTVVDLYYNHATTPLISGLPVVGGSLTVDSQSATRRSGSITIAQPDLIVDSVPLTLEPYGIELGIRMGVVYPDGKEELVPVGKFLVTNTNWPDDGGNIPTLSFGDRSAWLSDVSTATGYVDYGGKSTMYSIIQLLKLSPFTNVNASLDAVVDATGVGNNELNLVIDSSLSDFRIPTGTPFEAPYWDDIQQLAASIGAEVFFDVDGVNVYLRRIPSIDDSVSNTDVDFIINKGVNGNLISASRSRSRDGAYNAVRITGVLPDSAADAATPPSVFVYDSNPSSRTWYFGPYGQRVYQMTSDTVSDNETLTTMAEAKLATLVGLSRSLSLTCIPDPSMDAGDIIRVDFLDGTSEYHMIKSISLDLSWQSAASIETIATNQL